MQVLARLNQLLGAGGEGERERPAKRSGDLILAFQSFWTPGDSLLY